MVRPYLALPPSIVRRERLFSTGGWFVNPRRARITTKSLRDALRLHLKHSEALREFDRRVLAKERDDDAPDDQCSSGADSPCTESGIESDAVSADSVATVEVG